jgi:hypothetical protein
MKSALSSVLLVLMLILGLPCEAQRLQPGDLVYRGAFRLPGGSTETNWEYSGHAMAYCPEGDRDRPDDGYPGSIFATGHDHQQHVSEISIPAPVISPNKRLDDLNTARTLQGFQDINNMFGDLEIPCAGLAYLPAQGSPSKGRLCFCWGQHFQFEQVPSHGWCGLNLSNPNPSGPWLFDGYSNYVTNDYLFEIPKTWADANTPGQCLATGRFREGGWSGGGPALFAFGPWIHEKSPGPNTTLQNLTPLLLYGTQLPGIPEIRNHDSMAMNGYKACDHWSGGAWLTAGDKSAVVLVGTKALGRCWYGFANGVVWPIDCTPGGSPPCPNVPDWPNDNRGWWAEDYAAHIIFYDPMDLAGVAKGTMQPHEPQPYAFLNIDPYLFDPHVDAARYKRDLVGAMSFDPMRGLVYVFERQADGEKSLIHVWSIETKR